MSLSVSSAEAGLLAAPWAAAEQQDPNLVAAARLFYEQTKDLTQHGKHDHPTDRIVLDDTAATLALELGADPAGHRPATLTTTVILPGSGDTFSITVTQGGKATYKSEHDGRAGAAAPAGAATVLAAYTRLIGHVPSQDELAGFLAACVASTGSSAPTASAAGSAASAGAAVPMTITARGSNGQVLAVGTPDALLATLSTLVVLNNGITPNFDLPGNPSLLNATEAAACLLGLTVHDGTTTAPLVAAYDKTVSWFDSIDQPMLQVAAHYAALATHDAGNAARVTLDQTAETLALRIASEPEGHRGSLTQAVHVDGHQTDVTVSQTTTDVTGGAQFHDIDSSGLAGIFEQIGTVVLDVLAVIPVTAPIAAPLAVAANAAEAGESFSQGNVLGGVLDLASTVGIGLSGLGAAGGGLGLTAKAATTAGQLTLEGTALVGGAAGTVQAAERGDGLGVAAGLLQSAAAVTGAVVSSEGSGASSSLKLSLAALGGVATAASIGDAAETGGHGLSRSRCDRPIQETVIHGQSQQIAATTGSNRSIVGANPVGSGQVRTIKLMADYQCFPLWDASPGTVGNVDPGTLPISASLREDLQSWARLFGRTLDQDDPLSSGFSTPDEEQEFKNEGQRLGERLKIELGNAMSVVVVA